jgi:hypothetical protein
MRDGPLRRSKVASQGKSIVDDPLRHDQGGGAVANASVRTKLRRKFMAPVEAGAVRPGKKSPQRARHAER